MRSPSQTTAWISSRIRYSAAATTGEKSRFPNCTSRTGAASNMGTNSNSVGIIHHLPRTGGTLISRCLGAMQGVALLSEINPNSLKIFDPIKQAAQWHDLYAPEEIRDGRLQNQPLTDQIADIAMRCMRSNDSQLVIRDWSHIDFIGFPYNQQPSRTFELTECLRESHEMNVIATVRHPLDQYLSMRRLDALKQEWDEATVWEGILAFAKQTRDLPVYKFEDFVESPLTVAREMASRLGIPFDESFIERWHQYANVTGNHSLPSDREIRAKARMHVGLENWAHLASNQLFFEATELLGYEMPDRFTRSAGSVKGNRQESTHPALARKQSNTSTSTHTLRDSIAREPTNLKVQLSLQDMLTRQGEQEESLIETERTLTIDPDNVSAITNRIQCLENIGHRYETISFRRRLMQLVPSDDVNSFTLAHLLTGVGGVDEAINIYRSLLLRNKHHSAAAANYLLALNYSDRLSAIEIASEHFRIGAIHCRSEASIEHNHSRPERRIRIGYLSSDFFVHPVGKIMRSVVPSHDRSRFEISLYHDGPKRDGLTSEFEQSDGTFFHVHDWSNEKLHSHIVESEIDVLVDLNGFTAGGRRLPLFARRAAPLQVSFLGYPNTTAIPGIDCRITDRFCDPPGKSDSLYSEQLLYLPTVSVAWKPYDGIADSPRGLSGPLRIGAFNNLSKITRPAIKAWSEILSRNPGVVLTLKYGDRYGSQFAREKLATEFAERGVFSDQLEFQRKSKTLSDHMKSLANVDLAVDTFPYQGTMTTLECLAVGTPVLSLCGESTARRATSAMLAHLNLEEIIANDEDEYVEIACQLLSSSPMLRGLRETIWDRFMHSELVDPTALTKGIEDLLTDRMAES